MNFLASNNLIGLAVGIITFLTISLFHPLVIKAEYYIGVKSWWLFLILGITGTILSISIKALIGSIVFGVIAFSSFWSILEVFEQRKRVAKGWFPSNPKKETKKTAK